MIPGHMKVTTGRDADEPFEEQDAPALLAAHAADGGHDVEDAFEDRVAAEEDQQREQRRAGIVNVSTPKTTANTPRRTIAHQLIAAW